MPGYKINVGADGEQFWCVIARAVITDPEKITAYPGMEKMLDAAVAVYAGEKGHPLAVVSARAPNERMAEKAVQHFIAATGSEEIDSGTVRELLRRTRNYEEALYGERGMAIL